MPGGQQTGTVISGSGTSNVGIPPDIVIPVHNPPFIIKAGLHLDYRRRPVGLPGVFIGSHPFEGDGSSRQGALGFPITSIEFRLKGVCQTRQLLALGTKRIYRAAAPMSAFEGKADVLSPPFRKTLGW